MSTTFTNETEHEIARRCRANIGISTLISGQRKKRRTVQALLQCDFNQILQATKWPANQHERECKLKFHWLNSWSSYSQKISTMMLCLIFSFPFFLFFSKNRTITPPKKVAIYVGDLASLEFVWSCTYLTWEKNNKNKLVNSQLGCSWLIEGKKVSSTYHISVLSFGKREVGTSNPHLMREWDGNAWGSRVP